VSNRYIEYIGIDPEPTNLIPFSCIYLFKGEKHRLVIYAHNWSEAHSYAQYHGLVVEEKLSFGVQNEQ
jgi:hypothetical protein